MKKTNAPLCWALGIAACLFYLAVHTTYYNFDGVACAIAVELGDFSHLAHGNHLAYGIAGWLFYRLWQLLGYGGPAILCLQVLDSLLGGAGIGVFCAWLLRLKTPRPLAVLAAAGLCVSQAYWLWSLEAQVYMLGVFFLLMTARELSAEKPRPLAAAFWHGLAVLGHVGHAMFFPIALAWLWREHRSRKPLLVYTAGLAALGLAAYGAAAAFCVRPRSFNEWRVWLLGSAALTLDKSFIWFGGYSWRDLGDWAAMNLRLFADAVPLSGTARALAWSLGGSTLAAAGLGASSLKRSGKSWIAAGALAWILSYAVLFASWQPSIVVYRISDLVPLWLLIAWGACRLPRAAQAPLLAAWIAGLGLFNWRTNIRPKTDPAGNQAYQEALWIASAAPEAAWIAVDGLGQVYVPYFAHRRMLNLQYYHGRQEAVAGRLDALNAAGERAFISADTLAGLGWKVFEDYGLEPFARQGGMTLYRLRRRGR